MQRMTARSDQSISKSQSGALGHRDAPIERVPCALSSEGRLLGERLLQVRDLVLQLAVVRLERRDLLGELHGVVASQSGANGR